jgi:acyl phosphate:glycerol-3-phosphate acyltransferase
MTATQNLLCLIPLGYLSGSIPVGLLVGKAKGIDVRKAGSGNIGATNVGRVLGKKFFWLVFGLDLLKGLIPSLAAGCVIHFQSADWQTYLLWMVVGFAAILGHMFSVFLGFKGGKGVSTSGGALLGIWPYFTYPAVAGMAILAVVLVTTGYMSVASMVGAVSFCALYVLIGELMGWPIFGEQLPLLVAAIVLALLIIYQHRENIRRLLAGTEHKTSSRR